MSARKTSIIWFRRDLRINDHPALLAAIESADQVIPLFILDKTQISEAGEKLLAYMGQSLRALDESLGNRLHIIEGDQVTVLKELIEQYDVQEVHISAEYERYGAERDAAVEAAFAKVSQLDILINSAAISAVGCRHFAVCVECDSQWRPSARDVALCRTIPFGGLRW